MADFYGLRIGDTMLLESIPLTTRYGVKRAAIKHEDGNKAGHCLKDRRNAWVLMKDDEIGDRIVYVLLTYGNDGNSMGELTMRYEEKTGKKRGVVNVVPEGLPRRTKKHLRRFGSVVEADLSEPIPPDKILELARKKAHKYIGDSQLRMAEMIGEGAEGYGSLAGELYNEDPDYVFLPMGSGESFCGVAGGFEGRKTRVVGATVEENVNAKDTDFLPRVGHSQADKLVCGFSNYRGMVEQLLRDGHKKVIVTEEELAEELRYLNDTLNLDVDPNAAVAFAAAKRYSENNEIGQDSSIVIVKSAANTGRIPGLGRKWKRPTIYATAGGMVGLLVLGQCYYNNQLQKADIELQERVLGMQSEISMRDYYLWSMSGSEYFFKIAQFALEKDRDNYMDIIKKLSGSRWGGGVDRELWLMTLKSDQEIQQLYDEFLEWRENR